jgi:integration host factor subunit alpha
MTLTKEILIDVLHDKTDVALPKCREAIELILEELKTSLIQEDAVKISGFGRWSIRDKSTRKVRNPNNQELITINARRVVTFSPSLKLRKAMNHQQQQET